MSGRRRAVAGLTILLAMGGATAVWQTGASPVLRTAALPQGESVASIAVDAQTGHVFVATSARQVRVLTASTGMLWHTIALQGWPVSLAVAAGAGHVFVSQNVSGRARVSMLDARGGRLLRTVLAGLSLGVIAIDEQGSRAFVASSAPWSCSNSANCPPLPRGEVAVLDAQSGRLLYTLHLPLPSPAVRVDGFARRLLVASDDYQHQTGSVSVFETATGRLLHHVAIPMLPVRLIVDAATGRTFVLAGLGPRPFAFLRSGSLYVLDTRTGALVRTVALRGLLLDGTVDTRTGHVFVIVGGPMRMVNASIPGGGGMAALLPTAPGRVVMLDGRSGVVLRTVPVGVAPAAVAVDARHGRVYVVNSGSQDEFGSINGTPVVIKAPLIGPAGISVLDATSGKLLRTVPVGTWPATMAMDVQAERAFIGDMGRFMVVQPPDFWSWVPAWLRRHVPFLPRRLGPSRRTIPGSVIVLDTSRL